MGYGGEIGVDGDRAPGYGGRPEMYGLSLEGAWERLMFCDADRDRKGRRRLWKKLTRSGVHARCDPAWIRVVEMNARR